MPKIRVALLVSGLALASAMLTGCNTLTYRFPTLYAAAPTSAESKQHWDITMAGIAAKSEPETRTGLNLLVADARSMRMSKPDADYMMHRLQRVSFAIDNNEWAEAQDQLQSLRWRYGRF
ncbi:MAG: hypothetical protein ABI593_10500 [Betaproteobacteria bacterium]